MHNEHDELIEVELKPVDDEVLEEISARICETMENIPSHYNGEPLVLSLYLYYGTPDGTKYDTIEILRLMGRHGE